MSKVETHGRASMLKHIAVRLDKKNRGGNFRPYFFICFYQSVI